MHEGLAASPFQDLVIEAQEEIPGEPSGELGGDVFEAST
jgi:hypothetical protein